jgi:undecaprenyl-diphosphatase
MRRQPDRRPDPHAERRAESRGPLTPLSDPLFRALRASAARAQTLRTALGLVILAGGAVAVLGTWGFAAIAAHVRAGRTQAFDDAVLTWVGQHRSAALDQALLEITFLGTGLVVMVMVGVVALFLWLTHHKYSAVLLVAATSGGIVLNNILKAGFDRPRPQVITWGTHAITSSFPSGHAMSAAVVYATIAYLAARLERHRWARALTMLAATVLIALIAWSRIYLGVHYPSDVFAGLLIGLAWTGFCMATLEAFQKLARRHAPAAMHEDEREPDD